MGTPRPVCQAGFAKNTLKPPLPAAGDPVVLSFHTVSGMYDKTDSSVELFVVFQYVPILAVSVVPPIPVTSGTLAGASTARPVIADVPAAQSAPPESPAAFTQVMPCAFA